MTKPPLHVPPAYTNFEIAITRLKSIHLLKRFTE